MAGVSFWVDSQHAGYLGAFNEAAIEKMLSQVVEFVRKYPFGDSDGVIAFLSDSSGEHFGEPPDTYLRGNIPFLCHLFLTAKIERLISTQFLII
jgi:hypothetical protein